MSTSWTLSDAERETLGAILDTLLPPSGSFPPPSSTGIIDDFIVRRVPDEVGDWLPYPWVDADGLRDILAGLAGVVDMTAALTTLQAEQPSTFNVLWRLAVFGFYSRPEAIDAIARDHAPAYHGAPLPLGYAHAIAPWDAADPLQLPPRPPGTYIATEDVRRVDLSQLAGHGKVR